MALTIKLTHAEPKHVMGEQYLIPVTLEIMDGETAVFTYLYNVKHNDARTIKESLSQDEVKYDLQKAINSFFKKESVKDQATVISNELSVLQGKLEIPK